MGVKGMKWGTRKGGVLSPSEQTPTPLSPKEQKELQSQKSKMMDEYQQTLAKHQGILLRHRGQAAEVTKRVNRLRKLATRFERAGNKSDALKMKNRINALLGESKKREVGVKGMKWGHKMDKPEELARSAHLIKDPAGKKVLQKRAQKMRPQMLADLEKELAASGVKGMKWGERKNGDEEDPKAIYRIAGAKGVAKYYGFEENPKLPGRMSDEKGNAIHWNKNDGSWELLSGEHGIHSGKDSSDLYRKLDGLGFGSKQVAASASRQRVHGKRAREKFFSPRYSGTNPEGDLRKRESKLHRSRESRGPIVLPFMKGQRKDEGSGWVRPGVYVVRRPEPSELTGGVIIKEF